MSRDTPSSPSSLTPSSALPPSHAQTLSVRVVAMRLFDDIFYHGTRLDAAFESFDEYLALNPLDRALVRMIVTTTLRRLGQIDDMIAYAMDSDMPPDPDHLRTLLRLSVAQVVFMDMPDHAAVNVAVDVAQKINLDRQKGLVNAVLRRLSREGREITTRQDIPRLSIPDFMFDAWRRAYGAAAASAIAHASLKEAPLDITIKDPDLATSYAEKWGGVVLPTGTVRLRTAPGPIDQMEGYAQGAWWVQDASASLPVRVMGDVRGKTMIDLCAAPGGKTAQAASLWARVVAVDQSALRLDRLRENMTRLGLLDQVHMVAADALLWTPDVLADIVLLDAPCTATGTLRRNPDLMIHRSADDVTRLAGLQTRLIAAAYKMVRPMGRLVYAVCSLQPEEGEDHIARTLKTFPDLRLVPITPDQVGGMTEILTENGCARTLPTHLSKFGGMDGFFVAVFEKTR